MSGAAAQPQRVVGRAHGSFFSGLDPSVDADETSVPRRVCVSVGAVDGTCRQRGRTSHSRSRAASQAPALAKRMPHAERGLPCEVAP